MTRPSQDSRGVCLWVRLTLKTGATLEGTMPNALRSFSVGKLRITTSGCVKKPGFGGTFLPDPVTIPAGEIESAVVLGVIGKPKLAGRRK